MSLSCSKCHIYFNFIVTLLLLWHSCMQLLHLKRIIPFCVHFYCDAYDNHISFQVETPSNNLFLYWTVTSTLRPNSTTAKFFVRNCVCEIQMAALEWFYWISPLFSLLQWVELNSTQICRILCEIFRNLAEIKRLWNQAFMFLLPKWIETNCTIAKF